MPTKNDWNDFKQQMKDIISNRQPGQVRQIKQLKAASVSPTQDRTKLYLFALFTLAVTLGIIIFAQDRIGEGNAEKIAVEGTPVQTGPSEIDSLKGQIKVLDEKVCLLGAAHNNNWYSLYERQPAEDIVYFGSDWRFNRRPPHLRIEDDRSERLLSDWSN